MYFLAFQFFTQRWFLIHVFVCKSSRARVHVSAMHSRHGPCKYNAATTGLCASGQAMQDGGTERLRETGGRGRGQGDGACTVTGSIKDEKGLGSSLKGLIK